MYVVLVMEVYALLLGPTLRGEALPRRFQNQTKHAFAIKPAMVEFSDGSKEDWVAKEAVGPCHTCWLEDQYTRGRSATNTIPTALTARI